MAKLLRLRRGTDTQHTTFTGAEGEVTVNTTNDSLHVHDGTTAGGTELAKADLSNVDGSLSNNLGFGDSVKATFGTGNDLEIFHDGTHSYIKDVATGGLRITTDGPSIDLQKGISENIAKFIADGACELYHDASKKLATTSTGIDVTGTVNCDGINIDGNGVLTGGDLAIGSSTDTSVYTRLDFEDSGGVGFINLNAHGSAELKFMHNRSGSAINGMPSSSGGIATGHAVPIYFTNNGTARAYFDTNGNFRPAANNTYDLGSGSEQWRNGFFDGTVFCDGIDCDGDATIKSASGILVLQDTDTSGTSAVNHIQGRDSAGANQWYYGSGGNADLSVWNYQNGAVEFGTNGSARAQVTPAGHFVPVTNNTYDLGTSSLRWRNVYTNDLNLSNEGGSNDVDGTWGSWTIQEGEDDLFLLNRRNGKKYKFNLSEVN